MEDVLTSEPYFASPLHAVTLVQCTVSAGEENSAAQGRDVDSTDDSSLKACLNDILL